MWYLRTLALEKSGKFEEAISSAKSALEISPNDEVLRSIMENIMIETLAFEDSRRHPAASYHAQRGREFESKNMSDQAMYEYRRALKINPYDVDSRQSYAKILLSRGLPGRQVEQLEFIQSLGKSTTRVNDAIESYKKLLVESVPNKWKIDVLGLDKVHTKIGLFYIPDPSAIAHPDGERVAVAMVSEVFSYNPRFEVIPSANPSSSYSEAFRKSRERGDDYFILLKLRENGRDIQLTAEMYVSKTGSAAKTFTVFRTGNDRFSNAVRRLVQTILNDMPIKGRIVKRFQGDGVINLGKADGIGKDQVFDILPSGDVAVANEGISLTWKAESLLGTFTITQLDEDVSSGKIERSGFYDRINPGDTVLLRKKEAEPLAPEPGEKTGTVSPILNLIRKIR
jgi:tetratricopeptide (TPR) repeat protein